MPVYRAPVRDMEFVLNEVIGLDRLANIPAFAEATPDLVHAVLEEGGKLCEEVLQPINFSGDKEGCTRNDDASVTPPKGFKEAYKTFSENGWNALSAPVEYGGQGLPTTIRLAFNEMVCAANMAFGMYPGLSHAAASAIEVHGTDEQKNLFLPKLFSGEWSGTMNLTEPHCGTDLGLLRTKAEPQGDGTYAITGTKIFISAGEHDMADNIIHLVLARLPDAPEGTKGISLFIVPKFAVDAEGNVGARQAVECGALEEKMGIHGNATCVMNYDGAKGVMLGEENKGLNAMFVMMNEARLGVALQGLAQSEVAYQNAADYARDRLQGRALTGPANPDGPADPIIVHPDVRRMLLEQRAFNEGARALLLDATVKADIMHSHPDAAEREKADDRLQVLTPVLKGYFTNQGFANTVNAQQIFGGHGYIQEQGMEQFVRDARIAQIYEGANGIQALDLVGRKLPLKGGAPFMEYIGEMRAFVEENKGEMEEFTTPLTAAIDRLEEGFKWFMENALANFDHAGAGSVDFMHLFGLTTIGHQWAKMAKVSLAHKGDAFYDNKVTTARFFMARMLPDTAAQLAKIQSGADSVMAMAADQF